MKKSDLKDKKIRSERWKKSDLKERKKSDPTEEILCQVVLERRVEVFSVTRKQNFELKEHKMKNELELQEIEF